MRHAHTTRTARRVHTARRAHTAHVAHAVHTIHKHTLTHAQKTEGCAMQTDSWKHINILLKHKAHIHITHNTPTHTQIHTPTENRRLCNADGELELRHWEAIILAQLKFYAERQLGQAIPAVGDESLSMFCKEKLLFSEISVLFLFLLSSLHLVMNPNLF